MCPGSVGCSVTSADEGANYPSDSCCSSYQPGHIVTDYIWIHWEIKETRERFTQKFGNNLFFVSVEFLTPNLAQHLFGQRMAQNNHYTTGEEEEGRGRNSSSDIN